jgi:hypothetical protein
MNEQNVYLKPADNSRPACSRSPCLEEPRLFMHRGAPESRFNRLLSYQPKN